MIDLFLNFSIIIKIGFITTVKYGIINLLFVNWSLLVIETKNTHSFLHLFGQ